MKAWLVRDKYESCSAAVVFAETRGKAKAAAKSTDACEDSDFCDIEARRLPQIDKYYKDGKWEMDWNNYECEVIGNIHDNPELVKGDNDASN